MIFLVNLNLLWSKLPTYSWGTCYVLNWAPSVVTRIWDGDHQSHIISGCRTWNGYQEMSKQSWTRENLPVSLEISFEGDQPRVILLSTHTLIEYIQHAVRNRKISIKMKSILFYSSFWQKNRWQTQPKSRHTVSWI